MTVIDYYKTLGLTRGASQDEVRKAYRNLSLKFHPLRNTTPGSKDTYLKVAESFDILGDAKKRAVYDQHGADGLVRGIAETAEGESYVGGYAFDPSLADSIFFKFFGVTNPFDDLFAPSPVSQSGAKQNLPLVDQSVPVKGFGTLFTGLKGLNEHGDGPLVEPVQPPPREIPLKLTLEELYKGTMKKVKIERKVLKQGQLSTEVEEKTFTVEVRKGWKAGTRIVFPKEGDQGPNQIPNDVVFVVQEIPHSLMKRKGHNLYIQMDLSLKQALTGTRLSIPSLDDRTLHINVSEVVKPGYSKVIPNEGMPMSKSPNKHGDLIVTFNVQFPNYIDEKGKELIQKALSTSSSI